MASTENEVRFALEKLHDDVFAALDAQHIDAECYMVIHRKMKLMFGQLYVDLLQREGCPEETL
jgi:hypothetical protein